MSTLAGQIRITVTTAAAHAPRVAIANSRPVGLATRLAGLEPEAALRRVSLLYSACRSAQTLAGCEAIEAAHDFAVAPEHRLARSFLLAAETVLEHAQGIFLHWPQLLGKPATYVPTVGQLHASLGNLARSLYPQNDWMRPGGGLLQPDHSALAACLHSARNALSAANLASLPEAASLEAWLQTAEGPAANLLRHIEDNGWQSYGAGNVAALEAVEQSTLGTLLAHDENLDFVAQPTWQGAPHWTGPLARQSNHPLVHAAAARHGCGLAAHLFAQCIETQRMFEEMHALLPQLKHARPEDFSPREGSGLGLVQAARGLLAHRVEIATGHLTRYQILAPTEWNFHPRGIVAQGLAHSPAGASQAADLFIAALDTCVPCSIDWQNR